MKKIEVKNIIGGVSQQPALQRFENQCSAHQVPQSF